MAGTKESEQQTRERKLAEMKAEMLAIIASAKSLESEDEITEAKTKLNELDAGVAQLEQEIKAFQEGYNIAILGRPWQQLMFAEVQVIPISENEIPF